MDIKQATGRWVFQIEMSKDEMDCHDEQQWQGSTTPQGSC